MESKPLSYDSQKILMKYLSYSTRTKVARRCPALKNVEKIVPLTLKSVNLGNKFTLDNMKYHLHFVQKCPEGVPVPRSFQHGYNAVLDNLDEFGCVDLEDRNSWTAGDIRGRDNHEEPEDLIATLEGEIAALKAHLPEDGGLLRDQIRIEKKELKLQAHINRRDNQPTPYEHAYRLRIFENEEEVQCLYSKIDMPFSLKVKQLASSLFGGRRELISVKKLTIDISKRTIRMPSGQLFKVQQLHIPRLINNAISAASVLDDSSFPLQELSVNNFEPEDINCAPVRNARNLSIRFSDEALERARLVDFAIENDYTQLTIRDLSTGDFSYEDVIELTTQARARGREFHVLLLFNQVPDFSHRLEFINSRFQGQMIRGWSNYSVIPMRSPPLPQNTYLTVNFNTPIREFQFLVRVRTLQFNLSSNPL